MRSTSMSFRADGFLGSPEPTEEATPVWADVESIPYERMWEDDVIWLPLLLRHQPFAGRFVFDGDLMLTNEIELHSGSALGSWEAAPAAPKPATNPP